MKTKLVFFGLLLIAFIQGKAQHRIYTVSGDTISCRIQQIEQDFIIINAKDEVSDTFSQDDIIAISTFILDPDFYLQNFALSVPYKVVDLYLKDKLIFVEGYSFGKTDYRSIQAKVMEVVNDTVTILFYSDARYRLYKIATVNLKDFVSGAAKTIQENHLDRDVLTIGNDSSLVGNIVKWENSGVTIKSEDSMYKVSLAAISFLQLKGGSVYQLANDVVVPRYTKPYPRLSIAIGLGSGQDYGSSGGKSALVKSDFTDGKQGTSRTLTEFILKTNVDFNKHFDIQMRFTTLRSGQVIFSGTDHNLQTTWETAYKMRARIYEVGLGYNIGFLRLGAGVNVADTKSDFRWQQITYNRYGAIGRGLDGVIVSRPHLGFSLDASYALHLGKKFAVEPEICFTNFTIDFDRLMRVSKTDIRENRGTHAPGVGEYNQFRAEYASNHTNWNTLSFNIMVRRYLFRFESR